MDSVAVQDREDSRGVALEKVGITGLAIPLQVAHSIHETQSVTATVTIHSSLGMDKKGIHLSELMHALDKAAQAPLTTDTVRTMLSEVCQGDEAGIEIAFTYFMSKVSPVSGTKSPMNYAVRFIGTRTGEKTSVVLEVNVPMMTSCPDGKVLTGCAAHSQRGIVTVRAEGDIWFTDLITQVESAGTEVYQVLSKEDDKYVMEKAYQNPQFAEDLARDVMVVLEKDSRLKTFSVRVENMESNHNYNAFVEVRGAR